MSGSLPQLQEQASARADEFCSRYVRPAGRSAKRGGWARLDDGARKASASKGEKFYRRREPEASPFYQLVREHFDEFERVYPERYQKPYGFWRPVIRACIDKFLKCGDLKEGFARVRCPDCKAEYLVAFSCRARGACPSCDQKRSVVLAHRLNAEVLADVPHRQWVFTMPRRLRVYFRYDRSLLGKLCRVAYEIVREAYALELGDSDGVPAMIATPQSQGDLLNWNVHVHAVVAEGVFTPTGEFVALPHVWLQRAEELWRDRVFALLLDTFKIDEQTVASMRSWRHSGLTAPVRGAALRAPSACSPHIPVLRVSIDTAQETQLVDSGELRATEPPCAAEPKVTAQCASRRATTKASSGSSLTSPAALSPFPGWSREPRTVGFSIVPLMLAAGLSPSRESRQ